jgi:uncharacterized membrane protein
MWENVSTFLEKVVGLLTSQRTAVTVVGVIVIVVLMQNALAVLVGIEGWTQPDEVALEAQIAAALGTVATALIAIKQIVDLIKGLVGSIETAPPSLRSDWKDR